VGERAGASVWGGMRGGREPRGAERAKGGTSGWSDVALRSPHRALPMCCPVNALATGDSDSDGDGTVKASLPPPLPGPATGSGSGAGGAVAPVGGGMGMAATLRANACNTARTAGTSLLMPCRP